MARSSISAAASKRPIALGGVIGLTHAAASWDDARLLAEPIEAPEIDRIELLDLAMQIEDTFGEDAVIRCRGEVAKIVQAAKE